MAKQNIDSNVILQAVDVVVNKRIQDLDLDKTVIATIDQPLTPARDGSHRIKYAGGFFTAYASPGTTYAKNTTVYVQVPQNNFSNRKIILGPATGYYSQTDIETVSTALNNYMPVGQNTLTLVNNKYAETGYGLNSYADYTYDSQGNPLYQETILLYDKADYKNSQYTINFTDLETYLKDAKAIMLQADFRTSLLDDQKERAGAEYGLVFDMVFKNRDGIYKSQGELFAAVSQNTKSIIIEDGTETERTMQKYKDDVDTAFATIADLTSFQLDVTKTSSYVQNFLDTNWDRFSIQEKGIFEAFKYLLLQISTDVTHSKEQLKEEIYDPWFEAEVGLTEEQRQQTKVISYVLNSSEMTGDPFNFLEYNTQYVIFPIDTENFDHIERIYFYEKGFNVDQTRYNWVDVNRYKMSVMENGVEVFHGKDIWVRNLKLLALREIASEYGDYKFKIETPQGSIFREGEIDTLTVKANVLYKEYNPINSDCTFYWFIKDSRVTSTLHNYYDWHGGIGWRYIGSTQMGHIPSITLEEKDNQAYENKYMCAAVYAGSAEGTITLKQYFTLYNESKKRKIDIVSSLGTKFKFDAGTPTLTCIVDDKEELFEVPAKTDEAFKFIWIRRNKNGQVFQFNRRYDDVKKERDDTVDYNTRLVLETEMNNLRDVEYPKGIYGNQLIYPVKYLGSDTQATFECQVYTTNKINTSTGEPLDNLNFATDYYSIGSAEIVLSNEGLAEVNEYSIVIENGNQVFQYSESGVAPTFASTVTPTDFRHTDPIEIQTLKAHFYTPNGIEVSEGTYTIQWKYPLENTLILPPEGVEINAATGEYDLVTSQTLDFHIADSFDYNALNNQIQCIVKYGGQTYTRNTDFYFGKIGDNGTSGTDIVARIVVINDSSGVTQKHPLTAYIYNNEVRWNIGNQPQLAIQLYNRSELIDQQYVDVRWDILGGINRTKYLSFTEDSGNSTKLVLNPSSKTDKKANQIIQASASLVNDGQVYYAYFPIVIGFYSGDRLAFEEQFNTNRINLDNSFYLKQILYNSDGRTPIYNKNQGIKILNVERRYINWNVKSSFLKITKEKNDINGVKTLKEHGLNTVYILPENEYDGADCDNIIEATVYVSNEDEVRLENYYNQKKIIDDKYNEDIAEIKEEIRQEKVRHRRVLNAAEVDLENDQTEIARLPNMTSIEKQQALKQAQMAYDSRIASEQMIHENHLETFNEALAEEEETYKNAISALDASIQYTSEKRMIFSIPIYMALNTHGLASLNAWDGNHVDINEDGGYIVAPQIGAGVKHNEDNTFTGIVMGKMSNYNTQEEDVGLLGLSRGKQSIFLDSKTGNAFFGLPEIEKFGSEGTTDYNEGRIELIPGDISKIGGWRFGRRSLYYTSSGNIGQKYNEYADGHTRDINHNETGILLSAIPSYISIKGRILKAADVSNEADTNIKANDSLEVQIDPQQRSILSIFVHRNNVRTLLSGVDNKGRFIANKLQNGAGSNNTAGSSTSFAVSDVLAFANTTTATYVGAQFEAGSSIDNTKTFVRIFSPKDSVSNDNGHVYITGGKHNGSEYTRPFSIHGSSIGLYTGGTTGTVTNNKVYISDTNAYIGTSSDYLNLNPSSGNTELKSSKSINIKSSVALDLTGTSWNMHSNGTGALSSSSMTLASTNAFTVNSSGDILLNRGNGHRLSLTDGITKIGRNSEDYDYLKIITNGDNSFVSSKDTVINSKDGELYFYAHSNAASTWQSWNSASENGSYISIMGLSGAAAAAITASANGTNVGNARGHHEINITTGRSNYYIRSDFGIRDYYTTANTVQYSGGWKISPGINTGWIYSDTLKTTGDITSGNNVYVPALKTVGVSSDGNLASWAGAHTHPFSKGVTVGVCLGGTNENPGVGSNAYLRVDPSATGTSTAELNTTAFTANVSYPIVKVYTEEREYYTSNSPDASKVTVRVISDVEVENESRTIQGNWDGDADIDYTVARVGGGGESGYVRVNVSRPGININQSAEVNPQEFYFTVHGTSGTSTKV